MLESLEDLADIFMERKKKLVRENRNNTYTGEQVRKVLDGEVLDIKTNMPIDNTAINLSIEKLLELQKLEINSLEGKKILDIGGGFTSLPFLLNGIKTELNIVDPIFSIDIKQEIYRNKEKIFSVIKNCDKKNYENYLLGNKEKCYYYNQLNVQQNSILKDLSRWGDIDINNNCILIGKSVINIYPTTGEQVDGFDENSQDFVFINHTITKNQVNPYILLDKVYKLLKIGGKMYITESGEIDFSRFELFNEDFLVEKIYVVDKSILILEKI